MTTARTHLSSFVDPFIAIGPTPGGTFLGRGRIAVALTDLKAIHSQMSFARQGKPNGPTSTLTRLLGFIYPARRSAKIH